MVGVARGRRDARIGQSGQPRRHTGEDAKRNAGGGQSQSLLTSASEDERVSTLQTEHPSALARELDQPLGDVTLDGGRSATTLSGEFEHNLRPGEPQDRVVNKRIVYNDVCLAKRVHHLEG